MIASPLKKVVAGAVAAAASMSLMIAAAVGANAADANQATITLKSATSLADRTFVGYRPIDITGVTGSGTDTSYTLDITDDWLSTVRSAAITAGLTTDGTNKLAQDSSKADVLAAVSQLAADQQTNGGTDTLNYAGSRAFANALQQAIASADPAAPVAINSGKTAAGGSDTGDWTLSTDNLSLTSKAVDYGWYLIEETTAADPAVPSKTSDHAPVSLVITNPVTGNVSIDLKSTSPESHKNIVNADGSNQRKADDYAENTRIDYQLTYYVPTTWATQYSANGFWFTMSDKLSAGLTFDAVNKITVGNAFESTDGDVEWSASDLATYTPAFNDPQGDAKTGASLTWTFGNRPADANTALTDAQKAENLANLKLAGKWVKVYYTAHLNDAAVIGGQGNDNTYNVTYQHNPESSYDGEQTPEEHPHVYTYQFSVVKKDGLSNAALSGATFQLFADEDVAKAAVSTNGDTANAMKFDAGEAQQWDYNASGTVQDLTTDADGTIKLEGLDQGTYYIVETEAPEGYRLLGSPVTITVKATNLDIHTDEVKQAGTVYDIVYTVNDAANGQVEIKNYKGFLPQTGGAGIVLLIGAGLLLIVGGAIIVRRRLS
ncbi:MAG: SpaH/EbpB family LPXTG-anchored major pilin [Bifidobacterium tsurumiense]|uniref:SpaH/EbpB family LPXTG-anchored major pilin n=1 Tax=Bifidobacterium tsurumiense TaxID=356829 RepID=UPI002A83ABE9|nr:SpaH/EbpB family LPXTG-anchored major pilin [Bifidobacterium tsurumiense]MDY4677919.1 SpaH/EbpB family LPXTG-anchored major pilin [Bifidobacterium tsurumiense]